MRDHIRSLRVAVLLLWPLAVYAAGESLGSTLGAVTGADWVSLLALSFVSGLVALLHRLRRSMEAQARLAAGQPAAADDDRQLIDWRVFAVCHMAGAMLVGFIAFALCEAGDLNSYLEAALIALASWGGAKFADRWADSAGETISNLLPSRKGSSS